MEQKMEQKNLEIDLTESNYICEIKNKETVVVNINSVVEKSKNKRQKKVFDRVLFQAGILILFIATITTFIFLNNHIRMKQNTLYLNRLSSGVLNLEQKILLASANVKQTSENKVLDDKPIQLGLVKR